MKRLAFTILNTVMVVMLCVAAISCDNADDFSASASDLLTFSVEAVELDTVFSNVPSPTASVWVYNKSDHGIRMSAVSLEGAGEKGFRVNVDGMYVGPSNRYVLSDIEVAKGDSIRIFVELTAPESGQAEPQEWTDRIVFRHESGAVQFLPLKAMRWDAVQMKGVHVTKDSVLTAEHPIIIYDNLIVDEGATLTVNAGTQLYFHAESALLVMGRLVTRGTPEANVVMRGDRIDRMFDYLPYDNVSGQWSGVHFFENSYGNIMAYTDIHSAYNGMVLDSCDVTKPKLQMERCTIHNCQGYGLASCGSNITLRNCVLSNTQWDCLYIEGGKAVVQHCTLAQFYPFVANRGTAIRFFNNTNLPLSLTCTNSLITGYGEDELMGTRMTEDAFDYLFAGCVIRTPKIEDDPAFQSVVFEDSGAEEPFDGADHFRRIDTDSLRYDFRLDSLSTAIGAGLKEYMLPADRDGKTRTYESVDAGAYMYRKE